MMNRTLHRTCRTLLRFAALASLLAVASVSQAALTRLESGQPNLDRHGWKWGLNDSPAYVSYRLPRTSGDLVVAVQAFDVGQKQIYVRVNRKTIGILDRSPATGRMNAVTHWYIPASLLTRDVNIVTFQNRIRGKRWGIRYITAFDVNERHAIFGNADGKARQTGTSRHIRLRVPAQADANAMHARFFDTVRRNDVSIVVNGRRQSYSPRSGAGTWGRVQRIALTPGRHNRIDFIHRVNLLRERQSMERWALQLLRLVSPIDNSTGSSTGSTSSSSGGTSTPATPVEPLPGLATVSTDDWNVTAVRKILHTFAFGGHATESQIRTWANMNPRHAITQMLNGGEKNPLLSPQAQGERLPGAAGTLRGIGTWLSSSNSPVPAELRSKFGSGGWQQTRVWSHASLFRGFNPFRQRLGLWETNYHMAVNKEAGVDGNMLIRYYDEIMQAHATGQPYERIVGTAAKSAAVARQYNHDSNRYKDGICECNEDFAREFYQLFFGILGKDDPHYHETVTIKNMAHALTDMKVHWREESRRHDDYVTFGTRYHYPYDLEILHGNVSGQRASERIDTMASRAINHPESLATIPVNVVQSIADDNLDEAGKEQLRQAWAAMEQKDMIRFLQNYAVSTLFHNPNRRKYWTSVERNMLIATRVTHTNAEAAIGLYAPENHIRNEDIDVFTPRHNVFGGQTGEEAAATADIFLRNYNRFTDGYWKIYSANGERYGTPWEKNWSRVIPPSSGGTYIIKDVAEFLWNYIHADGLKNFGPLERAQVYSLLEGALHIQYRLDPDNHERVLGSAEVSNTPRIANLVQSLAASSIALRSSDQETRRTANKRVGAAVNFIAATPYIFAQEGK